MKTTSSCKWIYLTFLAILLFRGAGQILEGKGFQRADLPALIVGGISGGVGAFVLSRDQAKKRAEAL